MSEEAIPAPTAVASLSGGAGLRRPRVRISTVTALWIGLAASVIVVSVAIVAVTGMRPGYDAFGWLVWGRQVLHWNLNTDGAPSWKPITFLFTLPFALAGRVQMSLWTVTAVAGALTGAVFAARIAVTLTGPCPGRRFAAWLAGAFAAFAVLGISGYEHQVLIADSDPLVVTLCLAAIDCHLNRRPRLAFAAVVLAALGRPEAWPFALLSAALLWRRSRRARPLAAVGLAAIPALWFVIPALTSKNWFISGDLALSTVNPANVIHGSKIIGVLQRFGSLYEAPMQLAVLGSLGIAALIRDRRVPALGAAAAVWIVLEIALAMHGWSAAARYMFEPAAILVVVAAAGVGRALAYRPGGGGPARHGALGWIGPVAVAALLLALVPTARTRVRVNRAEVRLAAAAGREVDRLQGAVARAGGASRVKACGQPVTLVGSQSAVAWAVGLNVGNVGFRPGHAIAQGEAVVVFKPHLHGWQVHSYNVRRPDTRDCAALRFDSPFG
ncbi:MAG: hypothetical protein ABSH51_12160 [Solirubrobacteraceae bacterium]|jgi:hypothetical protein